MDVSLTAKLKTYDDFLELYRPGDEGRLYGDSSLLFYSLANNDPEARYKISSFLLDRGADVKGIDGEGFTPLDVLLSRVQHEVPQTAEMCRRLIEGGVDMNARDKRHGQTALYWLARMDAPDSEMSPLYDCIFSVPNLDLTTKDRYGQTPADFIRGDGMRKEMLQRMEEYGREH